MQEPHTPPPHFTHPHLPQINPEKTQLAVSITKVLVAIAAVAAGAFGGGRIWADLSHKISGVEQRVSSVDRKLEQIAVAGPKRSDLEAYIERRVREELRVVKLRCWQRAPRDFRCRVADEE